MYENFVRAQSYKTFFSLILQIFEINTVVFPVTPFQPCLMCAGMTAAYSSEASLRYSTLGGVPSNIRLGCMICKEKTL